MNKNSPKMNTYTTSSSYTAFPVYDRSSGTIDPLSFYPPLINDTKSNSTFNISQSVLKKQEQEIKSQLSPTFWDRLNEATKRATSNINLYDYNAYSNYPTYGSVKQSGNKSSSSFHQNGIPSSKPSDTSIKYSYDTFSNRISNYNQIKSNDFSSVSNTKNRILTNNDNNSVRNLEKTGSKISILEKSQTFANTTSKNQFNDENVLSYLKNIGRPIQRTQAQTLTQPPPQISIQNKPSSPSKSIFVPSSKSSANSFELNQNKSYSNDDKKFMPVKNKIHTYTEPSLPEKLPSAMSTVNIPQFKQDFVQRSKTMALTDNEKLSKSFGINITPSNLQNFQNKIAPVSGSKLRNFHKSLTIRSRVNNFYKDFVDEKNAYLSSLSRTNSDLNLKMSSSNLAGKESEKIKTKMLDENSDDKNEKTEEDQNLCENKNENALNNDGVSFSTGEIGYFSNKNVERAAETDTWKLHKSSQFVASSSSNSLMAQSTTSPGLQNSQFFSKDFQNSETRLNINSFYYSENATMQKFFQLNPHKSMKNQGALRFFFARHGERIDLAFGPQWIEQAFDRNGKYRRVNLNMPTDLPFKPSKREFLGDSPLTEIGQFQARLTGEALGYEGYKIHYCYTSPALRCIQTATQILAAQGLEKVVKIRIEPSIFEFLGWYDKGLPAFVNIESLVAFGYNIDTNYKPLLPLDKLQQDENYTDYYQRSFNVTKYLSNIHQNEGGNILVVGHAGTLEVCTRQITGMPVRPYAEFNATIRKVPYLGLAMIEKEAGNSSFEIQGSVIPALGHTSNFNFDPMALKL